MAVDVKEAVARARDYLVDLFPVQGKVDLEEVEPDTETAGWRITFSYDRDAPDPLGIAAFLQPNQRPSNRVYKVVSVDSDGRPEAVKMRDVN